MRHSAIFRGAVHGIIGLLSGICATLAHAQPLEWPAPPEAGNESSFDERFDFSSPLPAPARPGSAIDPSKFTAGPTASSGWDAKAGLDYRTPPTSNAGFRPDQILPGAPQDPSAGVAWANVTAPGLGTPWSWDKTSFEGRIDPEQDGKLGMTLSRSVPVGDNLAVTLQNGYVMTQTFGHGAIPMPGMMAGAVVAPTGSTHAFETNQALRFSILPLDTTLSLGGAFSSTDDKWLPALSAEQRLFGGPLSVIGEVSESATGEYTKSLKAGFKRTW